MKTKFRQTANLNSLISTFSVFVSIFGFTNLVIEVHQRIKIGVGLTDEAFGLLFGLDRARNGQTSNTYLFADLTAPILNLTQFNVIEFRRVGFLILVSLGSYFSIKTLRSSCDLNLVERINYCLIYLTVIVLVSSSFRFLLITPSYQWIVMVASIFLAIILFRSNLEDSFRKSVFVSFAISTLVVLIEFSRLTSGAITWIAISTYLLGKFQKKKIILINFFLILFHSIYFLLFHNSFYISIQRYYNLSKLDPNGSNLLFEILDVGKSTTIFTFLILAGARLGSIMFIENKYLFNKNYFGWKDIAVSFSLIILLFDFQYRDISHLLSLLFVVVIGFLLGIKNVSINFFTFLIATLPILTQFGSNINANYLLAPNMLSGVLILFMSNFLEKNSEGYHFVRFRRLINASAVFFLALILFSVQNLVSTTSYENSYGSKKLQKDTITGLMYDSNKLKKITDFRNQIDGSTQDDSIRVLDLSFWHPGVLFYIEKYQFPLSTLDRVFSDTLNEQVKLTLKQLNIPKYSRVTPILLQTSSQIPSNECRLLQDWNDDYLLNVALKENSYNPFVKEVAVYISSEEDITLFPRNISYLVPCN